jgi:hypothetical protein
LFTISIPFASAQSNPNKYYNVNLEWYSDNWVNIAPAPNTSALARPSYERASKFVWVCTIGGGTNLSKVEACVQWYGTSGKYKIDFRESASQAEAVVYGYSGFSTVSTAHYGTARAKSGEIRQQRWFGVQ